MGHTTDVDRFEWMRETAIDESLSSDISPEEIDYRARRGEAGLAGHLDPAAVVQGCGERALFDAIDDETTVYLNGDDRRQGVRADGE